MVVGYVTVGKKVENFLYTIAIKRTVVVLHQKLPPFVDADNAAGVVGASFFLPLAIHTGFQLKVAKPHRFILVLILDQTTVVEHTDLRLDCRPNWRRRIFVVHQ